MHIEASGERARIKLYGGQEPRTVADEAFGRFSFTGLKIRMFRTLAALRGKDVTAVTIPERKLDDAKWNLIKARQVVTGFAIPEALEGPRQRVRELCSLEDEITRFVTAREVKIEPVEPNQ